MHCCLVNRYQNEKRLVATKAGTEIEKTNLYKLVVRKAEGKRLLLLDGRMTIKWILQRDDVGEINVVKDKNLLRNLVNMVTKHFCFYISHGMSLIIDRLLYSFISRPKNTQQSKSTMSQPIINFLLREQ